MIVTLKGTISNIEVSFLDHENFVYIYGYKNLNSCYSCNTINTLNFKATNFAGFWDNLKPTPMTDTGAGEKGSVFRGSKFSERLITWNFTPVVQNSKGNVSPQTLLNSLINSGEVVEVLVDNKYKGYFYFLTDTSSESGIISMATADINYGTYWNSGSFSKKWYFYEANPYIPKQLPQILLSEDYYPMQINFFSEAPQTPVIKIGGALSGEWLSFKLDVGYILSYDNSINKDDYIIIDTENLTIINQNGVDRSDQIIVPAGNTKFPKIKVGYNNWLATVNDTEIYSELIDIPNDTRVEVTYEELSSSIGNEVFC